MTRSARLALALASVSGLVALTGCGIGTAAAPDVTTSAAKVGGHIMGGHQPVNGSTVSLYEIVPSAYGAAPSQVGNSVTTGADGNFTLTGNCTNNADQIYVVAQGGDAGAGVPNNAATLVAALGTCSAVSGSVIVDEVTTVAAAYALSGFADMSNGTSINIGAPTSNATGLAHAFLNAANLVDYNSGQARTTTPSGNGTVPTAILNTLANALAACVNSTGAGSSGCSSVLVAPPTGVATVTPANTWQLALNWARYPGNNVAAVYGNPTAQTTFYSPAISSTTPSDLTVGIGFGIGQSGATGNAAVTNAYDAKADGNGNIWVSGGTGATMAELTSTGSLVSTAPGGFGYGTVGASYLDTIAIDPTSSLVWSPDSRGSGGTGKIYGFSTADGSIQQTVALPSTVVYNGGSSTNSTATQAAEGIAVDPAGNVWFSTYNTTSSANNYVGEIQNTSGTYALPASYAGNVFYPANSSGSVNVGYNTTSSTVFISNYSSASPDYLTPGGTVTAMTSTGNSYGEGLTFDASGATWFSAYGASGNNGGAICHYSTATASPACSTVPAPTNPPTGSTQYGLVHPRALAIDGVGHFFAGSPSAYPAIVELAPEAGFLVNAAGNGFEPQNGTGTSELSVSSTTNYQGGITIDGTGALWITNTHAGFAPVIQILGPAAPTVTPLAAGSYGTRP